MTTFLRPMPSADFPDDLHGTTLGKLYAFRDDGKCAECLAEAWERQTYGGLGAELARRTFHRALAFDRPAEMTLDPVVDGVFRYKTMTWTIAARNRGE